VAEVEIRLTLNGEERTASVEPRLLLSDFIRHSLRLTGTHVGCEHGVCGACTVLVDGEPQRSCLMFAVQADGASVRTVESLADGDRLHPLQEAFKEAHALQCGYCTPGFLMMATAIAAEGGHPSRDELRDRLAGVLCRCTGYQNILTAMDRFLAEREEAGAVDG
jgi:aerobic-type carbon monoxide dehydrogenase small subunit (CoxS/CutS family)